MTSLSAEASVTLATCRDYPEGPPDDDDLVAALARRGCRARWASWDDRSVNWQTGGVVVVRSTWDYTSRSEEFLDWADGVPLLRNPAALIRWNHEKSYLDVLQKAGVPAVPTILVAPGGSMPSAGALEAVLGSGMSEAVVKPTVSAGSRGAGRFPVEGVLPCSAVEHVAALHSAGFTAMIQPFLPVDKHGEISLIFLGDVFSHAVRRAGMLPPGQVHGIGGRGPEFDTGAVVVVEPNNAEHAVARSALKALPSNRSTLYARVDLFPGPDGPVVNELESIEPGLFLTHSPGSADRFAEAIAAATCEKP